MNKIQQINDNWDLSSDYKGGVLIPNICIPFDVHSVLLAHEIIVDPYYGDNEKLIQDVHKHFWSLSKKVDISADDLKNTLYLELTKVDIFADILINGQKVYKTDSMYARHRVDLNEYLQEGENTFTIKFHPIEDEIAIRQKQVSFYMPYIDSNKIAGYNLIRKPQCNAGWDWGITLSAIGIYEPLKIGSYKVSRLDSVTHKQTFFPDGAVEVKFKISFESFAECSQSITIRFNNEEKTINKKCLADKNSAYISFMLTDPILWYPAGFGEQHRYNVEISLDKEPKSQSITQKIGLRKLEVVNEADKVGVSMFFRVNDIDIFAKGTNWIPNDALPQRQTEQKTRYLLKSAKDANMNMIRIWGGGQYEYEYFYDICDELGILIWHDLMFACSLYSSDQWFMNDVQKELEYQIPRISSHPSLAMWCGDNEVIGAIGWYEESKSNRDRYLANYVRLNFFIEQQLAIHDPYTKYWVSSPCNGGLDFGDSWHDDSKGDMHYWEVWHSGASFDSYYKVKPRFCSEFGFQSFPSLSTIKTYATPDQFNISSPIMEHHQKNDAGNSIICEMFTRLFRMPNGFENTLYLSQLQQSLAMCIGIEFWRTNRPTSMGSLYWQLNDNWPVASWSSIEYNGRYKQLHYHLKKAFSPLLQTLYINEDKLNVYAVNDTTKTLDVKSTLKICKIADCSIVKSYDFDEEISGTSSKHLMTIPKDEYKDHMEDCFALLSWFDQNGYEHHSVQLFNVFKHYNLPKAQVFFKAEEKNEGSFEVELTSDKPAFFTNLEIESDNGHFTFNSLHVMPGNKVLTTFTPQKKMSLEEFKSELKIIHLGITC